MKNREWFEKLILDMGELDFMQKVRSMLNNLSPYQKEALHFIKWYQFGARATGRTYIAAIVTILQAIENPGREISIADHHSFERSNNFLVTQIDSVLNENRLTKHFRIKKQGSKYNLMFVPIPIERMKND